MGTYNGTYLSAITLGTNTDVTLGPQGLVDGYGLAGTFDVPVNGTAMPASIFAALAGPAGTQFTITNQGLIETHGTNTTSALDLGIALGSPGTVINEGTILGASGVGMLDATNSGLSGSIVNAGMIHGSIGVGVYLAGGEITNSGTLSGVNGGVQLGTAGQVQNSLAGTISASGTSGAAVDMRGGGMLGNAGAISSYYVGVALAAAGSVLNTGTIRQTGLTGSGASYAAAIVLQQGGEVTNQAGGLIAGARGILDTGATGSVSNAGSIKGGQAVGVYFLNSGTVVNHGTITGHHRAVVDEGITAGGTGVIVNAGLLQGQQSSWIDSNGTVKVGSAISMFGAAAVTNQSSGTIIGANGIYLNGRGSNLSLDNAGLIIGSYQSGIVLATAGYVHNGGSISGTSAGILAKAAGAMIVNDGVISAIAGNAIVLQGPGSVRDAGTIAAAGGDAISFSASNANLDLDPGAVIIGSIVTNGGDFLTLDSGSSAGSFDMGGTASVFWGINFADGAEWTLAGNTAELASTDIITGFAAGDTLVLEGFTATSAAENTITANDYVLELGDGGTTVQINFDGAYAGDPFTISAVAGGTEIHICYLRGTRILTPEDERPVEDLRPGDAVVARRAGITRLKWIGRQAYAGRFLARDAARLPVRICAGALGAGLPRRDLIVSPGHSLLLGEQLVLARDLVNGVTVLQNEAPDIVEYFALELEGHDCVIAEGAFAESFADGPGLRRQFHNVADFYARFPLYVEPDTLALCAPRPESGPLLEAALQPVLAQARALAARGALRGYLERCEADGQVEGWAQDIANPELPVEVEIRADGTAIGTALAHLYRGDLREAGIGKGHAMFRFTAPPGQTITAHDPATGEELPLTWQCQRRRAG